MFVRVTSSPNSPRKSVKIVASVREGMKVKQIMIHNVGVGATEEEIEKLKKMGRAYIAQVMLQEEQASKQLPLFEPETVQKRLEALEAIAASKEFKKSLGRKPQVTLEDVSREDRVSLADLVEEQRIIEGIHEVAGHVYDLIGYNQILEKSKDKERLKDLVLMRLANPSSKWKAQKMLDRRFGKTHDLDALYRLMDKVHPKIADIKTLTFNRTKALTPQSIDILFYDCTTLYFESVETDDLRKFGYSKDHRFNTTQVVLALASNSDGLPIGYELFEGNKAEVKTLLESIESWKKLFNIGAVCFVADRAMMSIENMEALESKGYQYVMAAKLKGMGKEMTTQILDEQNYQGVQFGDERGRLAEFSYKDRRLVISYKESRAKRDQHTRDQVVEKIKKRLGNEGKTDSLITNQGVKKYTKSDDATTVLDQGKIHGAACWDGLHGVITNIKKDEETAQNILGRYGRLWKIEESFRLNKHTLSMRPIFHFKETRIHAHIAMCYMAFSVLRHMEYTVRLTQKITPQVLLEELMDIQASLYRHLPTGRVYRMPGKFTHIASKIYKAFNITRKNNAQVYTEA